MKYCLFGRRHFTPPIPSSDSEISQGFFSANSRCGDHANSDLPHSVLATLKSRISDLKSIFCVLSSASGNILQYKSHVCISDRVLVLVPKMSKGTGHLNSVLRYHFSSNMNAANQHGTVSSAIRPLRPRSRLAHDFVRLCEPRDSNRAFLLGTRLQAESGVNHRKQRTGARSTRYTKGLLLASRDAVPGRVSSTTRCPVLGRVQSGPQCFASRCMSQPKSAEINRRTSLLEIAVSYTKQRPDQMLIASKTTVSPPCQKAFSSRSPALTDEGLALTKEGRAPQCGGRMAAPLVRVSSLRMPPWSPIWSKIAREKWRRAISPRRVQGL
jgi:hypothetical protein